MPENQYLPIVIFLVLSFVIATVPLALGWLLGPKRPNAIKNAAYECGFEASSSSRLKFDVRFYIVAILFIIFDLELAFLIPWAVVLRDLNDFSFWGMMLFLLLLTIGFIYEWKKGALEWE